jgi:hypothetical protein
MGTLPIYRPDGGGLVLEERGHRRTVGRVRHRVVDAAQSILDSRLEIADLRQGRLVVSLLLVLAAEPVFGAGD